MKHRINIYILFGIKKHNKPTFIIYNMDNRDATNVVSNRSHIKTERFRHWSFIEGVIKDKSKRLDTLNLGHWETKTRP